MRIVTLRRWSIVVGVVVVLIPVLLSAAPPEPAKTPEPAKPSPAEKVRYKLNQTITLEINEDGTLVDALAALTDKTGLTFVVWERDFEAERLLNVESTPIARGGLLKLKDVKAKDALRRILAKVPVAPSEATAVIIGDKIVVTTTEGAKYHWMQQEVNLDFEKEELSSVLKKLARETGTNLVIDARNAKEAVMPVTLQAQDVSLETAVVLLAEMVGLKPVRYGNILFLTSKENAAEMRKDPERANMIGPCPLPPYLMPGQIPLGGVQ